MIIQQVVTLYVLTSLSTQETNQLNSLHLPILDIVYFY